MARNMTFVLLLCALAMVAFAEELYSDKYDYIDVAAVLANERIRNQYFKCFADKGPCITPDAVFFKEVFPEAIVTKCRRCNQKQKESMDKIIVFYTENEPEQWREILETAIKRAQKKTDTKV